MKTIVKYLFGRPEQIVTLAATTAQTNCTNCSQPLTGSYCHECGQKKIDHHDASIGAFVVHTFHEFTHIDSKVLRTFKYLIFKPGFLTREFIAGHRKKYMNPVQLFIVINLIYFLFIGLFASNPFALPLRNQIENGMWGRLATRMVNAKIAEQHISYDAFEEQFNHDLTAQAKSLVIVMVPIFSLFLSILYIRQRRYFVEHLVFSVNLFSFFLIALGLGLMMAVTLLAILFQLAGVGTAFLHSDSFLLQLISILLFGFLFVSLRRVYNNSRALSFFNAGILVFAFWATILIYRFLLFLSVFYSIKLSLH